MKYGSVFLTLWKALYPEKEFDLKSHGMVHTLCNSTYLLDKICGHFAYNFHRVYMGIYSDEIFEEVHNEVKYNPFTEAKFKNEVNDGIKKLKKLIEQRNEEYSEEDWVAALAVAHYFKDRICPPDCSKEQIRYEIHSWRWSFPDSIVAEAIDAVEALF